MYSNNSSNDVVLLVPPEQPKVNKCKRVGKYSLAFLFLFLQLVLVYGIYWIWTKAHIIDLANMGQVIFGLLMTMVAISFIDTLLIILWQFVSHRLEQN